MGIARTDALKRVTKAICGQDGETAGQEKKSKRTSETENKQPSEEGQLSVDHHTAVSRGSTRHPSVFTYLM